MHIIFKEKYMHINPVKINSIYLKNIKAKLGFAPSFGAKLKEQPKADIFTCQKKTPDNKEAVDYSDTVKFSEHLENKMSKMLLDPKERDIRRIISNVSDKTGLERKEVSKILSRLTQFSSYSQLSMFEKDLKTNKITSLARVGTEHVSLNSVIDYLVEKKKQITPDFEGDKECIFIDDVMLDYFEKLKNAYGDEGRTSILFKKIQQGKQKLVLIDGFNAKVDGQDVSHTLFGGPLTLEEATEKIARKMQEGASLDEILNGDTLKRIEEIFGKNTNIALIKNRSTKQSPKSIAKQMESIHPSKKTIEKLIYTAARLAPQARLTKEGEQEAREILSKYYDYMVYPFSQESLTKILKDKYAAIKDKVEELGKTMDDVVYLIPENEKSYDLITYNYAKTNNIPKEQIKRMKGRPISPREAKDKTFVILDDIAGTGTSITVAGFNYKDFCNFVLWHAPNSNLIFSPVCMHKEGKYKMLRKIQANSREGKDFIISNDAPDYGLFKSTLQNKNVDFLEKTILSSYGFGRTRACTSMPYMVPDNDSSAAGFLLQHTIKDSRANKADGWDVMNKRVEEIYREVKNEA